MDHLAQMDAARAAQSPAAGGFLATFLGLFLGLAMAVLATLILLDPFGSGRLIGRTALDLRTPSEGTPSKTAVARIRHEGFDSYVLGNSTLQTLDPVRLGGLTGRTFATLTIPGTGPMEQMAILDLAIRERGAELRTLVIGLDLSWCDPARVTTTVNPFPFWLYERSLWRYLVGVFRYDNLEALPRRINLLLGRGRMGRIDGFWDYQQHVAPRAYPYLVAPVAARAAPPHSAISALVQHLRPLSHGVRVVAVLPPMYRAPAMGGTFVETFGLAACKQDILAALAPLPQVAVVDGWVDTELNRGRENFIDATHFISPIARDIERQVAAALAALP